MLRGGSRSASIVKLVDCWFNLGFRQIDSCYFQGDIMDNKEFKLPDLNEEKKTQLVDTMSHVRWGGLPTLNAI